MLAEVCDLFKSDYCDMDRRHRSWLGDLVFGCFGDLGDPVIWGGLGMAIGTYIGHIEGPNIVLNGKFY